MIKTLNDWLNLNGGWIMIFVKLIFNFSEWKMFFFEEKMKNVRNDVILDDNPKHIKNIFV